MDKVADMDVVGDMDGCRGWGEWVGHRGYCIFFEKRGLIQKRGRLKNGAL